MVPGVDGALPVLTVNEAVPELPQPLLAFTLIVPPLAPAVTAMLSAVEVPVHPFGRVHV